MKKIAIASLLAVATSTLCATPLVLAQAAPPSQTQPAQPAQPAQAGAPGQPAGQGQQITIKDPAEYNDYSNAISQSSPAAKAAAIEAFLTKYPNSVVKQDMLEQLMAAYQATGNLDKTVDAANRLLQVDPNNLRALAIYVYIKKSQAAQKTTPADAQPLLDDAAAKAQTGLNAPKPANMSDADYQKLKAATTPIFYSAIALDDENKKDYAGAVEAFRKELQAVDPASTQSGPSLNDTYLLGQAYAQMNPPDLKNAVWFLTRAAQYAPPAAKPQIEQAAEYYYKKYHGSMDGFDQVKQQVQTSVMPTDAYNPTAAPPPPSPADQAAQAVASTPDLKTLSLGDKEFILFNGKPEDAEKVWAVMKGVTAQVPGKVISATPESVQLAVTPDAQGSNTADFTINMKEPLKEAPQIGSNVTYTATFDSYTQNPKMIVLSNGTPPAAAKAPAHAPAHRKRPAAQQ
jgi:tetratricopeptide (TPR) repeat protein